MSEAVGAHLGSLMSADTQAAARAGTAEQHKACRLVLGEIRIRTRLIDPAVQQPSRALQAASLQADRRQRYSLPRRGPPEVLTFAAT